jgi:tetratricopeptide (TPR) repeat protein
MRPFVAAVVGGAAVAAAALAVVALRAEPPAPPPADTSAMTREIAALRDRLDRLERIAATRPRVATEPPASPPVAEQPDVPDWNGRGSRDAPVAEPTPAELSKVSSADLALEADERHARDYDIAGALKRYRELLCRASTPADRRHWLIRVGDCYVRLRHEDEAAEAYRGCIDASTEDHPERVACMIYLARRESASNAAEAMRWLDRAEELESGRENHTVHELAADAARELRQTDREIREIQWLVDHHCSPADGWADRLALARGEKR